MDMDYGHIHAYMHTYLDTCMPMSLPPFVSMSLPLTGSVPLPASLDPKSGSIHALYNIHAYNVISPIL